MSTFVVIARLLLAVDQLSGVDLDRFHSSGNCPFLLLHVFIAHLKIEIHYMMKPKRKLFLNTLSVIQVAASFHDVAVGPKYMYSF